jgi:DNA primase
MPTPAEELEVDGVKVRLTNPDKVYFPKLGSDGTKRKLVEYYMAVASASTVRRSTRSGSRRSIPSTCRPAR